MDHPQENDFSNLLVHVDKIIVSLSSDRLSTYDSFGEIRFRSNHIMLQRSNSLPSLATRRLSVLIRPVWWVLGRSLKTTNCVMYSPSQLTGTAALPSPMLLLPKISPPPRSLQSAAHPSSPHQELTNTASFRAVLPANLLSCATKIEKFAGQGSSDLVFLLLGVQDWHWSAELLAPELHAAPFSCV